MRNVRGIVRALGPADAARRMRITIKALRYYEKRGLVTPRRTSKGWRVYDREELGRLEQILAFKAMGFGLSQIASLLDATPDALAAALVAQELDLKGKIKDLKDALDAVRDARENATIAGYEPRRISSALKEQGQTWATANPAMARRTPSGLTNSRAAVSARRPSRRSLPVRAMPKAA